MKGGVTRLTGGEGRSSTVYAPTGTAFVVLLLQGLSMFTGRTKRQGKRQEEEVPEPGSDSTYGVRSLGDSDWGSVHGLTTGSATDQEETLEEGDASASQDVQIQESTPTSHTEPLINPDSEAEPSPSSPVITSPRSPITDQIEGYYRHTLPDDLSEPSSPASFASMPSYISSSLSRTSSLGPDTGRIPYQFAYPGMGGSEELVMPTLNVSQGQGQGSRRVDEGRVKGIKVVVLGDEDEVGGFMEEVRGREGMAELGGGRWGLGDMVFTISSGTSDEVSPHRMVPEREGLTIDRDEIGGYISNAQWGITSRSTTFIKGRGT